MRTSYVLSQWISFKCMKVKGPRRWQWLWDGNMTDKCHSYNSSSDIIFMTFWLHRLLDSCHSRILIKYCLHAVSFFCLFILFSFFSSGSTSLIQGHVYIIWTKHDMDSVLDWYIPCQRTPPAQSFTAHLVGNNERVQDAVAWDKAKGLQLASQGARIHFALWA